MSTTDSERAELLERIKNMERNLEYMRSARAISAPQEGWQTIETAPKDGSEFLAIWGRQGNVVQVVKWNHLHKFWQSKGEPVTGFATNATAWHPLPSPPVASRPQAPSDGGRGGKGGHE